MGAATAAGALPDGKTLRVDGGGTERGGDQLILYHAGSESGHTGTNAFGVEVAVSGGKVVGAHDAAGNSAIPTRGFALSAHGGAAGTDADALRGLKAGDAVKLVIEHSGTLKGLDEALAARQLRYPVAARCGTLCLAMSAAASSSPDTPLGQWVVRYADGSAEFAPVRYGREVLSGNTDSLPRRTDGPMFLIEQPPLRCLVREWTNPHPGRVVQKLVFEPGSALLETGAQVLGVTAAEAP